uniref:FH1/FH2 domain-containing protein 3 n=1 Tax=Schistocephalus solidus TaxID=70667 RepID=A0A0V0J6M9_SCHSO
MYGKDYTASSSLSRSYGASRHGSGALSAFTTPKSYGPSSSRTKPGYTTPNPNVGKGSASSSLTNRYLRSVGKDSDASSPRTKPKSDVSGPEFKVMTNRGTWTEDSGAGEGRTWSISATTSQKVERLPPKSRVQDRDSQTMDDIFLPSTKVPVKTPETPKRLNIGGRYMRQASESGDHIPARSSWRESVYGIEYKEKKANAGASASVTEPKLTEAEQRRREREKQMEMDRLRHQSLEEEREERRLRQMLRKATWEKDEKRIREVDEEIQRLKEEKARRETEAAKEQAAVQQRPHFTRQSSFRPSDMAEQVQDPIKKVADWQRQNALSSVKPYNQPSPAARKPLQREETLKPSSETMPVNSVYTVSPYTDFDEFMRAQLRPKYALPANTPGAKSSYEWTYGKYLDVDVPEDEEVEGVREGCMSIVYKTKKAKELFDEMPTELQNLVVRAQNRPLRFAAVMELCSKEKSVQTLNKEEEQKFQGYKTAADLLHQLGTDLSKLENCILQVYRFGQEQNFFGNYLDMDATLQQQWEEMKGFSDENSIAIVLRTKAIVRVQAIINKLYSSSGQELRRALFSLKQIFQNDKDLVHEFVTHSGLHCLVTIGSKSDQTHQNYILRALGQLILYVDGMRGVSEHPETIRWLYSLLACKYCLVKKTALHLLSVFVGYTESNAMIFVEIVDQFHKSSTLNGPPWSYLIELLRQESSDVEILLHTMILINKVLGAVPDQETFYDITDCLEDQGIKELADKYTKDSNPDASLVEQFNIYEASLIFEDGGTLGTITLTDESLNNLRRTPRSQRVDLDTPAMSTPQSSTPSLFVSGSTCDLQNGKPRRSKRFSEEAKDTSGAGSDVDDNVLDRKRHPRRITQEIISDNRKHTMDLQKKSVRELYEVLSTDEQAEGTSDIDDSAVKPSSARAEHQSSFFAECQPAKTVKLLAEYRTQSTAGVTASKPQGDKKGGALLNGSDEPPASVDVKTLKEQHVAAVNKSLEPDAPKPPPAKTGAVSATKDMLAATLGKLPLGLSTVVQPPKVESPPPEEPPKPLRESDKFWMDREAHVAKTPLHVHDRDFSDLTDSEDDAATAQPKTLGPGGVPPPPPPPPAPGMGLPPAPPPPPPPPGGIPPPPPQPGSKMNSTSSLPAPPGSNVKKEVKTIRLHWSEWQPRPQDVEALTKALKARKPDLPDGVVTRSSAKPPVTLDTTEERKKALEALKTSSIWCDVVPVQVDYHKLEKLFENRVAEVKLLKAEAAGKKIEILDMKRSNAINIGMKVLPPLGTINNALIKMDSSVINREGIEKLLQNMLPTEEEIDKILTAKRENENYQLGTAEEFLLTLSEVTNLKPRLELWLFKLDYESTESEIIEPLMDLKQAVLDLQKCKTLRYVLSVVLAMGNFLNGSASHGFNAEYLARLPEVKDVVHKQSLLYHVCNTVLEQFPDSTDMHSELGSVCRCHRVDWDELVRRLDTVESDCRRAWEHYQLIYNANKQRNFTIHNNQKRLADFLIDAADRIIAMKIVKRRTMKRFRELLIYLGFTPSRAENMSVGHFCRIIAEFALEYRTTRERILEEAARKASERERRRTRGKHIDESLEFDEERFGPPAMRATQANSQQAADDIELKQALSTWRDRTDSINSLSGAFRPSSLRKGSLHASNPRLRGSVRDASPCLPRNASDLDTDRQVREKSALLDACDRSASITQLPNASSTSTLGRRGPSRDRRRLQDRTRPSDELEAATAIATALKMTQQNSQC